MTFRFRRRGIGAPGVALIEATMGTFLLLLAALGAIQFVLVLHGSLTAHSVASQLARRYALTRSDAQVQLLWSEQTHATFGYLRWDYPRCDQSGSMGQCRLTVHVPTLIPGVSLLGIDAITQTGAYPLPGSP
jgi:hypothetical protein